MKDLDNIFAKRLEKLGLKKQVDASMVVVEAQRKINEIFGPDAEKNLRAVSFNKGTLKVAARTSAWATECQGQAQKIKSEGVDKIVFETLVSEVES